MESESAVTKDDARAASRSQNILDAVEGEQFMSSVKRAETEAREAIEARDDMQLWAERLEPYFRREPHITVAEALQRYLQTQAESKARPPEES